MIHLRSWNTKTGKRSLLAIVLFLAFIFGFSFAFIPQQAYASGSGDKWWTEDTNSDGTADKLHIGSTTVPSQAVTNGTFTGSSVTASNCEWNYAENRTNITSAVVEPTCLKPTSCENWFAYMKALITCDTTNLDTSDVTDMSHMFYECYALESIPGIANWNTGKVETFSYMFHHFLDFSQLTETPDVSRWNTASMTDCSYMFAGCIEITETPNVSNWNTSKLKDCSGIFYNCKKLTEPPDVSRWVTSSLESCTSMFSGCRKMTETPDISRWDVRQLVDCGWMFSSCMSITAAPNVSSWVTSSLQECDGMFNKCSSMLTTPNISNGNVSYILAFASVVKNMV